MNSFIQPKSPRPHLFRWWHLIILLFPVIAGCSFLLAPHLDQSVLDPPDWKVSRGTNHMVIRLPATPGRLQEDLLIAGSDSLEDPWQVSRGPADVRRYPPPGYTIEELTDAQSRQLLRLRDQWCAAAPSFGTTTEPMQTYEMVFRCDETLVHFARFVVPADQLPSIVRELVVGVASPQGATA
jgi:hypothetical protein